jgi:TatA/E family protein of Tat protein translocase
MMQKRHRKRRRGSQMLSIPHLIIVFIVALVVFGPEKLPELARNLGKIMGEFKRATGDLRSTFEGHLRDLEREADQRRMRNESEIAATPLLSTAPPNELPAAEPQPGSVPTTPPHLSGGETPLVASSFSSSSSDPSSDPEHHSSEIAAAPATPAESRQPSSLEPGHSPETLTDAGIHPA